MLRYRVCISLKVPFFCCYTHSYNCVFDERSTFYFFFFFCLWNLRGTRASEISQISSTHCIWIIIASERFHSCGSEILKIDFKRHNITPVPLKCSALFLVPFIFFNLECASQTLTNVPLKCKTMMKNQKTSNITGAYLD